MTVWNTDLLGRLLQHHVIVIARCEGYLTLHVTDAEDYRQREGGAERKHDGVCHLKEYECSKVRNERHTDDEHTIRENTVQYRLLSGLWSFTKETSTPRARRDLSMDSRGELPLKTARG